MLSQLLRRFPLFSRHFEVVESFACNQSGNPGKSPKLANSLQLQQSACLLDDNLVTRPWNQHQECLKRCHKYSVVQSYHGPLSLNIQDGNSTTHMLEKSMDSLLWLQSLNYLNSFSLLCLMLCCVILVPVVMGPSPKITGSFFFLQFDYIFESCIIQM